MWKSSFAGVWLGALAVVAGVAAASDERAVFMGLGINGRITGLSSDGGVAVGQYRDENLVPYGSIWTRGGGWTFVPAPSFGNTIEFNDVSGDGRTIVGTVGYFAAGMDQQLAYRYTPGQGFTYLADLGTETDRNFATAERISRDGSTVVGSGRIGTTAVRAVTWTTPGAPRSIGAAGTAVTIATAVSADGWWVSGFEGGQGFIWDAINGRRPLNAGGPGGAFPRAMSDDGSVIVGGTPTAPWRWSRSQGMYFLPGPRGLSGVGAANGVSADGSVVVGGRIANGETDARTAFIWTEAAGTHYVGDILTMAGIDMSGWLLTRAIDVSADGRHIVGEGINPAGVRESWYAYLPDPIPAPGAGVVFGLAVVMVVWRRR